MKRNLFIIVLFISSTVFSTLPAQEVPCNLPESFICGAKKGIFYEPVTVYLPIIGFFTVYNPIDCCVTSIQTNACNIDVVGCSHVVPS